MNIVVNVSLSACKCMNLLHQTGCRVTDQKYYNFHSIMRTVSIIGQERSLAVTRKPHCRPL